MLRPMKLEGALKLYIWLYGLAFLLTFFTTVPMLYMSANDDAGCLLFTSKPPIKYGSKAGCIVSGLLPLLVAICAFFLGFVNWLHLRKTQDHIKLPEMTSDEFRLKFKKKFWKIIICHGIVVGIIAINAIILTTGYTTSCENIYLEVKQTLRARINFTPSSNRGNNQQRQRLDSFADDHTIQRYTNSQTDVLGRNAGEQAITCRKMFTDVKVHYDLKKNTVSDPSYIAQYHNSWNDNSANSRLQDEGGFEYQTEQANLIVELSMAGAWVGLFIWGLMLALMLKERHYLKAFLTDESMWGGSDYGGSVRSGRSRRSQSGARVMSPIDFENMEKMSHHSKMSYDRSSHISRASKSSKGTSYKDMSGSRKSSTTNSYKNMNGRGSKVPSQLTVSRLEKVPLLTPSPGDQLPLATAAMTRIPPQPSSRFKVKAAALTRQVPEVESDYTVNRLLNPRPPSSVSGANGAADRSRNYLAPDTNMDHYNDASSVADMSVMTVTGAIIGPGTMHDNKRMATNGSARKPAGGGLMDYFGGAAVNNTPQPGPPPEIMTSESDIM